MHPFILDIILRQQVLRHSKLVGIKSKKYKYDEALISKAKCKETPSFYRIC